MFHTNETAITLYRFFEKIRDGDLGSCPLNTEIIILSLGAGLNCYGTQNRILICLSTPINFSISPRDKELQPVCGPIYSMFLCFLCKSSQALQRGPGPYSIDLAAEDVWLDRERDW